jgi:phage tail protein X
MTKQAVTQANDTVDAFLSRHVPDYSDAIEKQFHAMNLTLEGYGLYLPAGLLLYIPTIQPVTTTRRTLWD